MSTPEPFAVTPSSQAPLRGFVVGALRAQGAVLLHESPPDQAPYQASLELPTGERLGFVAYAFLAQETPKRGRFAAPVGYGPRRREPRRLWHDPTGLRVTLLCAIDPERGLFVGADPWLHEEPALPWTIEYGRAQVSRIQRAGWCAWEREPRGEDGPVEVLVGGTAGAFLRYVRFERAALGEDQGHRHLLADRAAPDLLRR